MATGSGAEVSIVTSQRSPAVPLVSTVSASRTMSGYWRALMPMPSAPIIGAPEAVDLDLVTVVLDIEQRAVTRLL